MTPADLATEVRVALLEQTVSQFHESLTELRTDLHAIRKTMIQLLFSFVAASVALLANIVLTYVKVGV